MCLSTESEVEDWWEEDTLEPLMVRRRQGEVWLKERETDEQRRVCQSMSGVYIAQALGRSGGEQIWDCGRIGHLTGKLSCILAVSEGAAAAAAEAIAVPTTVTWSTDKPSSGSTFLSSSGTSTGQVRSSTQDQEGKAAEMRDCQEAMQPVLWLSQSHRQRSWMEMELLHVQPSPAQSSPVQSNPVQGWLSRPIGQAPPTRKTRYVLVRSSCVFACLPLPFCMMSWAGVSGSELWPWHSHKGTKNKKPRLEDMQTVDLTFWPGRAGLS